MGKANLYTVKDYLTGEVLAKGRAGELEASGIVPKGYHTSEWAKRENNRVKGRRYNISSELLHPEDRPRRREKGRTLNVYTCYDAAGNIMGEGTSRRHRKGTVGGGRLQQRQRGLLYLQRTGRTLHKARHRKNDLPKRDAEGRPEQYPR